MKRLPFDQPGRFWRGNLHTHTTISDGLQPPDQVIAAYRGRGYDFLAITDHLTSGSPQTNGFVGTGRSDGLLVIGGAELHPDAIRAGGPWHIVAVGLSPMFPVRPEETAASLVTRAVADGAFVTLAHPAWYGLTDDEAATIRDVHAIEAWNATADYLNDRASSWRTIDVLADAGSRVLATASDDAHGESERRDMFRAWIWVRAMTLDPIAIIDALTKGHFYMSTGPRIHSLAVDPGSHMSIECDPVDAVFATGRGWQAAALHGEQITRATLSLEGLDSPFFRVMIRSNDGGRAWTQTIWFE